MVSFVDLIHDSKLNILEFWTVDLLTFFRDKRNNQLLEKEIGILINNENIG